MFWSSQPDVIVVGAGLAGLRAATKLHKAGVKVQVIEARDRVGGRTFTLKTKNGHTFDMGANWIGPTQENMYELVKELGLKTQHQFHEGKHVLDLDGNLSQYEGNISDLTVFGRPPELDAVVNKLDQMAVGVDVETLSSVRDAYKKDHQTYSAWIDENVKNDGAKHLLKWFTNVCLAAEPSEISLLYFLMFLNQGGSYARLANIADGAQQETIIGGSQQVSEGMARQLPNGSLITKSPVTEITQTADKICVKCSDGKEYSAKYAIIALPMNIVGRIKYTPPLPPLRDQLTQRMPMGCVIKVILCYKTAWWKTKGFSGEVISDGQPLSLMYDKSSHDDKQAALVGFIGGSNARLWGNKSTEARKQAVLQQMRRFYPSCPEALSPSEYFEHDWTMEEFSRGCYVNIMSPGVMSECGSALRKPVGRIHWAGSETARKWMAYMDGAVESGNRASQEVLQRLSKTHKAKI